MHQSLAFYRHGIAAHNYCSKWNDAYAVSFCGPPEQETVADWGGGLAGNLARFPDINAVQASANVTSSFLTRKVEYTYLNRVKAGFVRRPQDWRGSSVDECSGGSAAEQERWRSLTIDRVWMPSHPRPRI